MNYIDLILNRENWFVMIVVCSSVFRKGYIGQVKSVFLSLFYDDIN